MINSNYSNLKWYNAPEKWEIKGSVLTFSVLPKTDYWRHTLHGFTIDDAPFYFDERGGEFEVSVKFSGEYVSQYDQAGLMFRRDAETWIKTGIEYVDGIFYFSTVFTNVHSNWSVVPLIDKPEWVFIKAIRRIDSIEISFSLDSENFQLASLGYIKDNEPLMVGMMGASPDGNGFNVHFDDFKIKHLPDLRRLAWMKGQE